MEKEKVKVKGEDSYKGIPWNGHYKSFEQSMMPASYMDNFDFPVIPITEKGDSPTS